MTMISDSSKPAGSVASPNNVLTDAMRMAELSAQHEELARNAAILSYEICTDLHVPRAAVHEVVVEPSPLVELMRVQAAHVLRQEEEAKRPWWKRWGFWDTGVAKIAGIVLFVIGVWTFYVEVLSK
ncbi:hypothetical protein [Pseudomonas sp. PLMAX]|uniref:hypothetical protein n=1 Tax=Pseudomonas sp. PLMAX TaxID=2201998 RepID=UPI0038BC6634